MKNPNYNDRYTIRLPKLNSTDPTLTPGSLMPVKRHLKSHVELVDLFGLYLFREQGYDFPVGMPRESDGESKAYFFLGGQESMSTVQPVGSVVFVKEPGTWLLAWIWIHPFKRNDGRLSRAWPFFKQEFGDFEVQQPLSHGMKAFIAKQAA